MVKDLLVKLLLGLVIVVLSACEADERSSAQVTEADLANTQWRLVFFEEQGAEIPVIEGTEVTLQFEANGQAGGMASCNPFGAQYSLQENVLSFRQFVVTHTTCIVEDAMQQESRYLQALDEAGRFELDGDRLSIHYGENGGVLNFVRLEGPISPSP